MSERAPQFADFIAEAKDHLSELCNQLLRFERATADDARASLEQMLRAAHSVKGGAAFFGFRNIEAVAHRMESVLELAMEGDVPRDSRSVDVLLSATDRIAAFLDDPEHESTADVSEILARLDALSQTERGLDRPQAAAEPGVEIKAAEQATEVVGQAASEAELEIDLSQCEAGGVTPLEVVSRLEGLGKVVAGRIDVGTDQLAAWSPTHPVKLRVRIATALTADECLRRLQLPTDGSQASRTGTADVADETGASGADSTSAAPPVAASPARGGPSVGGSASGGTIRVPVGLADRLMNLAGELVLVRNQSRRFAEAKEPLPGPVMQRLDAVTLEFQETVLQTRMQPIGNLFNKFPRLVRDLARQLNKQIELSVSGAEVELDKTILDAISDPLIHLVRNACDHGIETSAEREQQGKAAAGRIELSSRHFGDQIRITIRDDGRGIDREAVRAQAVKQGLRTPAELEQLADQELFALILHPGFSTAACVTEVSGRGVGMDVVKTNLAQLGGTLEIDSLRGAGTTFTLRLPLTLAIIPSLLVTAAGQRYALPQRDLDELVCVDADKSRVRIEQTQDQEVVRLRGRLLPLVRFPRLLAALDARTPAVAPPQSTDNAPVVFAVVKAGSRRYALVVDSVLTSEEIVVKPMHGQLRGLSLYSGATILGDGRVALILNTQGIAAAARVRFGGDTDIQTGAAATLAAETQQVLLVRHAGGPWAIPASQVRRIVMVRRGQIEQLGQESFITIDDVPTRMLRITEQVAAPSASELAFALVPRGIDRPVAFLVDEVLGTESVDLRRLHPLPDSPLASSATLLRGKITPVLDLQRLAGEPIAPATARGARILLVDDTRFFRDVVGGYLTAAGYDVDTAEDGVAALALLDREPYDLVVSDLEMPVMDGWAFAAAVRQREAHRGLPLLALTTLTEEEPRTRALASGYDCFQVKLDRESLLATVARLLGQRTAGTLAAASNA